MKLVKFILEQMLRFPNRIRGYLDMLKAVAERRRRYSLLTVAYYSCTWKRLLLRPEVKVEDNDDRNDPTYQRKL